MTGVTRYLHQFMRRVLLVLTLMLLSAPSAHAIVGGGPASEDYPWMVSLQSSSDHFCGGALIRPDWVLTAAHCPEGEEVENLSVLLGQHQLSGSGGERIQVAEVVMNEGYATDENGGHDTALLRLALKELPFLSRSQATDGRLQGVDERDTSSSSFRM